MTLFNRKIPPELFIAAPAFGGFGVCGSNFTDGLVLFAIICSMKKPWEYDD